MIKNKEDFKNKFIDLGNKELNGEVTEEVLKLLKTCFEKIGLEMITTSIELIKPYLILNKVGSFPNVLTNRDFFWKNEKDYKEVSIHDIAGFNK